MMTAKAHRREIPPTPLLMIFKNLIRYTDGAIPAAPEEPIMPRRQLVLSETQRQELVQMRDHARQPYVRERAAALLKIADGLPAARVARQGLLRPRRPDTVYEWLDRYQATGSAGMKVHPGRGRKPAFSPSAFHSSGGPHGTATPLPA
jgi:hypothetical protein